MLFLLVSVGLVCLTASSPLPAMVKYDQRQEGDWNVRADLENFVILIIPTSQATSPTGSAGGLGLLDLLAKAVPAKKRKHVKKGTEPAAETQAFIESKTAPYHVDISRSRNNLAKLHPVDKHEELLVSPSISLVNSRASRALSMLFEGKNLIIIKDGRKLENEQKEKKTPNKKEKLTLIGAEHEQCGPGYERDTKGICKSTKQ